MTRTLDSLKREIETLDRDYETGLELTWAAYHRGNLAEAEQLAKWTEAKVRRRNMLMDEAGME
jgi:hypothetical protein